MLCSLSYIYFFESLPFSLLTVRHIFEISGRSTHEPKWCARDYWWTLHFATLRCVRIFPGVNSRAELVTLAPGLRPERRFAPLARGIWNLFRVLLFISNISRVSEVNEYNYFMYYWMDHLHYRLNFDLNKSRQEFHHSLKDHHNISNIPKFRCEML